MGMIMEWITYEQQYQLVFAWGGEERVFEFIEKKA